MNNQAKAFLANNLNQLPMQGSHETGIVVSISDQSFIVKLDSGSSVVCAQALSCVYTPIEEDLVEVFYHPARGHFILSILMRSQAVTAELSHPHGIELKAPTFSLDTNSTQLISQNFDLQSQRYKHQSNQLEVTATDAHFVSNSTHVSTNTLMQKVKDSFKFIERIEHVKAKDIIQTIKNSFIQRSKQVDISAKTDVKINGDRIHMG